MYRKLRYLAKIAYIELILAKNGHVVVSEVNDVEAKFKVSNEFEWDRATNFINEGQIIGSLLEDIQKNDVFYDVGAAVGTYSCLAGNKIKPGDGQVFAFEPTPFNHQRLKENIELNSLSESSKAFEIALDEKDGKEHISIEGEEVGRGGHSMRHVAKEGLEVTTKRGDSWVLEGNPPPDVMKIDVEGKELSVLRGFGEIIEKVRVIYCELHPTRVPDIHKDTVEYLESKGFNVVEIGDDSRDHIRAVNTEL